MSDSQASYQTVSLMSDSQASHRLYHLDFPDAANPSANVRPDDEREETTVRIPRGTTAR